MSPRAVWRHRSRVIPLVVVRAGAWGPVVCLTCGAWVTYVTTPARPPRWVHRPYASTRHRIGSRTA